MRILALTAFAPRADATHGGARVMAGLLAGLADRHRVALAYLRGPHEQPPDDPLLRRLDAVVEVRRPEREPTRHAQRRAHAAALARRLPLWVHDWSVPAYRESVAGLVQTWKPEVAQMHFQVMAQYADALPVPSALVVHEPAAARAGEASALEALLWRRFERRALEAADATVALTERDRAALLTLRPEATVEVIPFGVDVPAAALDPLGDGETVVFVGNFRHAPNVDAAQRLATSIFPRVARERPSARLRLVGAEPPASVQALAGGSVEIAGSVPDVTPELDRAALVVIPLRRGGGLRVKTVEALAAGKAVVATPLALEGIAVEDGKQALVATSDEDVAAATIALLDDEQRRRSLARAARTWAAAHAGWDEPVGRHEALLQSLQARA